MYKNFTVFRMLLNLIKIEDRQVRFVLFTYCLRVFASPVNAQLHYQVHPTAVYVCSNKLKSEIKDFDCPKLFNYSKKQASPDSLPLKSNQVELIYFNVDCTRNEAEQQIQFNWATASEVNNDFFTIEQDSITKQGVVDWVDIAVVKATGHSTETKNYQYIYTNHVDEVQVKRHYYRLRQTYNDGVSIVFEVNSPDCIVQYNTIKIYPIPFFQDIIITGLPAHQTILYSISDVYGETIYAGEHFSYGNSLHLNLTLLQKGIYFIQLGFNNTVIKKKLVKEN